MKRPLKELRKILNDSDKDFSQVDVDIGSNSRNVGSETAINTNPTEDQLVENTFSQR